MLQFVTDYAVPGGVFALMLIVGTEVVAGDFKRLVAYPKAVLLGVAGQLLILPPLVLVIAKVTSIRPSVTTWLLLLSLCPGGAISNYYCYLARCNVPLSATITAIGTICSLFSIPLWIATAPGALNLGSNIPDVPALRILSQLVIFMIVPMTIGITLFRMFPDAIRRTARPLRWFSLALIMAILAAATWTVRSDLAALAGGIAIAASLFIFGAMLLGRLVAFGMSPYDGPVLVIESSVRNVGVALIAGRSILEGQDFGTFVSFLAGYFIIEIIILLPYALFVRRRLSPPAAVPQRS